MSMSWRRITGVLGLGLIAVSLAGLAPEATARSRTIYYLPYAMFVVNATGQPYRSKQVVFLGTVRNASCPENHSAAFQGMIQAQFSRHVESDYAAKLGGRHELAERIGYWRWDSVGGLREQHDRIARRYPNVEFVTTFVLDCAGADADPPPSPPGPPPIPVPAPASYTSRGAYACYGGAQYPSSWTSEASCNAYGCNFGRQSLDSCLAIATAKGAAEVIHGHPNGGRANECWLQQSCADLRPNAAFTVYRPATVPPPPPPVGRYLSRGAYACYGGARHPPAWAAEASCGPVGCNFGRLGLDSCLALAASKGAAEVIHGNRNGGRANECWLQDACADLRPNRDFTAFGR